MKKSIFVGLSAAALSLGGAAYAHNHMGGMMGDADGNGAISRAEAQTHAAALFARMDANKDSALTEADREARRTEHRTAMFTTLDTDKNGQVSRDEFVAFRHEGMHAKGMHREGKPGHHKGKHDHGGGMMAKMADTNSDGRITQAEFTAAALAHFDKADADKDGQVSAAERKAMHEQMRARMQGMKHDGSAS
jgi:EF-hand domain pair